MRRSESCRKEGWGWEEEIGVRFLFINSSPCSCLSPYYGGELVVSEECELLFHSSCVCVCVCVVGRDM